MNFKAKNTLFSFVNVILTCPTTSNKKPMPNPEYILLQTSIEMNQFTTAKGLSENSQFI